MSRLPESVSVLRRAVESLLSGESLDSRDVLDAIFAVNNEIGLLLRRSGDPGLKALQLKVNDVTVAAKTLDRERLREAFGSLTNAVREFAPE